MANQRKVKKARVIYTTDDRALFRQSCIVGGNAGYIWTKLVQRKTERKETKTNE